MLNKSIWALHSRYYNMDENISQSNQGIRGCIRVNIMWLEGRSRKVLGVGVLAQASFNRGLEGNQSFCTIYAINRVHLPK